MGIIAKYKFNQNTYKNFIPKFNSEFTDYTYTDEIDTDGYTIRTIGNDSGNLPTLIRFSTQAKSLLSVEYIDTSEVTDMSSMFQNCSELTSLDLSNFNTSKVTDMNNMFRSCSSLTSLDLSSFNTGEVTDMNSMFYGCSSLTSLNLSSFNTSKVTDMRYMFRICSELTSLVLSNFNTNSITNMSSMFYGCSELTSLDLSNFNTSKVTDMNNMFRSCSSLTSLDVSSFNTSEVTDMRYMFSECSSLTSLDVSSFDTKNVTNTTSMFASWTSSQKVYASSRWTLGTSFPPTFIITFVNTIAKYKFNQNTYESFIPEFNSEFTDYTYTDEIDTDGYTIRTIGNDSDDLPTLIRFGSTDTSGNGDYTKQHSLLEVNELYINNVTDMSFMFNQCKNLARINANFDTSNVTDMSYMFYNCYNLTSLDVSNFDTSNVTDMNYMFSNCSSLTSLDLSNFDTSNVTDFTNIFANTSKLTNIGLLYALASTINSLSSNMGTDIARIIWYQDADATELNSVTNIETKLYKTNILTVNEDVELRGIGEVKDELNLLTGELTQRIGEITFDGSENWETHDTTTTNTVRYYLNGAVQNAKPISEDGGVCDKIPYGRIHGVDEVGVVLTKASGHCYLRSTIRDLSEFKTWLQSNPITVQYRLATESIKTVVLSDNVVYSYDEVTHYDCSSEEGSLIPTAALTVPTNVNAVISNQRTTIQEQTEQINTLEEENALLIEQNEMQDVEIALNQEAINFMLFEAMGMSTLNENGGNPMAAYFANQIIKRKLNYTQVVNKYPQFKEDIDLILIAEGYGDLIVE